MAKATSFRERDLVINATAVFRVSITDKTATLVNTSDDNEEFKRFLKSIVNDISTQTTGRKFVLVSSETEVVSVAIKIVTGENDIVTSQTIADRLLREEIKAQQQIAKFGIDLHEGLLILTHIVDRGVEKFIICKADTLTFIEERTFRQRNGYPIKKKIFKSAQIIFDTERAVVDIVVNDINNSIAKYWWDGFLEVGQKWTDDYNTERAFKILDSKVFSKIRKESETDYWNIRNTSIRYFRSENEFDIEDYIEKCLGNYQPEKEGLDIDSYKEKIREFPEKHQFDSTFTLNRTAITARINSRILLSENIELLLKGDVEIGTIIKGAVDEENKKGVFIRSDEGYEAFKGG